MKKIALLFLPFLFFTYHLTFAQSDSTLLLDSNIEKTFQDPDAPRFNLISKDKHFYMGIGGFVRVVGGYDFNGLIGAKDFITADIPVYNAKSNEGLSRFGLGAATSRLAFKMGGDTKYGKITCYIESDFRGTDNVLRLRKAYIKFRGFLIGQAWSTFMDLDSGPPTIDFEGPNNEVSIRQAQVRYERLVGKRWTMAIAAEIPSISATYADSIYNIPQRFPDIPARVKYTHKLGHITLAGIVRDMVYGDSAASKKTQKDVGWGLSLSSKLNPTPTTSIYFQGTYGHGIANYIQDLNGQGLDLVPSYSSNVNTLSTIPVYGGYIGVQQYLIKDLFISATYGMTRTQNLTKSPVTNYKTGYYFAANAFYNVIDHLTLAIEYLWGKRVNVDNNAGDANRVELLIKYSI